MKIYDYKTLLNDSGNPYLTKGNGYKIDGRKTFNSPDAIVEFIYNGIELHKYAEEYLWILCLDSKTHLVGCFEISHGTVNSSYCSPREVFQKALMIGAVSIIMCHNHPSGSATPSEADIATTKSIKDAGDVVGVKLLDHIIVSRTREYSSLNEMGAM